MAMKRRALIHGARFWVPVIALLAYTVAAAAVLLVDARDPALAQLPQVQGTGAGSDTARREAAGAELAAAVRAGQPLPLQQLPAGTRFDVVWPDGSRETLQVFDPSSALGVGLTAADAGDDQAAPR